MGVRYEWGDDRQMIMNVYLEQPWTWTEYIAQMDKMMPLLHAVNHPCATAVDCSKVGTIPTDGNFLHILMNIENAFPETVFASAVVATPYVVNVFMSMLIKLRPRAKVLALFAQTMPEAHEKIYARYQELYGESGQSSTSNGQ